ncbi:MAG TPA: diacylglycerol kinase family protein [Candidatus Baltobacteraceae bacterium]|nr:diacylglycerol kinase family protein [Candidatus Baltobacteraceae bacterium]
MLAQLVFNERSRGGPGLGERVSRSLRDAGIETREDGWPDRLDPSIECIICAGGDGTIASAIGPAIEHGLPLGIIPLGTFNELARTLGIPSRIEAAAQAIAARIERAIDVGRVNDRYFIDEASIGFSSRVARLQTPRLKQRFGIFAIVATALMGMRHLRPIDAEVRYDGQSERLRTVQLTIANSHRFGGLINVSGASIDDGWLHLYSIQGAAVHTVRARRFEVRTRRPHRITADGEPAGATPATFEVVPKALRVLASR